MHNIDQPSNSKKEGEGLPHLTPTPPWSPEPTSSLNLPRFDNFCNNYQTVDYQIPQNRIFTYGYSNDQSLIIPSMPKSNQSDQAMPNTHNQSDTTDKAEEKAKIVSRRTSNKESKAYEREHIKTIKKSYIENDKLFEEMKKQVQAGADCKKLCEDFCEKYKSIPQKARRVTGKISKKAGANNAPPNSKIEFSGEIDLRFYPNISTQRFIDHEYYHRNDESENPFYKEQRIFVSVVPQRHMSRKVLLSKLTTKSKSKDELPELVPREKIQGWHEYNDQLFKQLKESFEKSENGGTFLYTFFTFYAPFAETCYLKKEIN